MRAFAIKHDARVEAMYVNKFYSEIYLCSNWIKLLFVITKLFASEFFPFGWLGSVGSVVWAVLEKSVFIHEFIIHLGLFCWCLPAIVAEQ